MSAIPTPPNEKPQILTNAGHLDPAEVDKTEITMIPNKDGLLVPSDTIEPEKEDCKHAEAAGEFHKRGRDRTEMKCHGCEEVVIVKTMSFVVLTGDKMVEFEENLVRMTQAAEAQAKRQALGLVLPGEENK